MHPLDWLAVFGLAALLPIPFYWLVIHPFAAFWRTRPAAAFRTAVPIALAIAWPLLYLLRGRLFAAGASAWWARVLGFALLAVAFYVFARVKQEMGADRLLGKTEVRGGGELRVAGLYQHLRHPSYAAQMAAMLGLCLLAARPAMWLLAVAWVVLLNLAIGFEERELVVRFGDSYRAYRRRVPAFLPLGRIGRE